MITMQDNNRNIYQAARRSAGLTQERAAEMLGVSVESLRAYETGIRIPPTDVVELMVICYDAQHLAYQHLRLASEMGRRIIPETGDLPLPQAAMQLINRIYAFADSRQDRALLKIAEDGKISAKERPQFDSILDELQGIVSAALALQCAQAKRT